MDLTRSYPLAEVMNFMSNPIDEYGLIGDGETAALIHRSGSIDWLCWPRFDSDACFAALLGTAENGRWKIAPVEPARISRRYLEDTLVLETEFDTASGTVLLTDFMPGREHGSSIVRIVSGTRGRTVLRSEMNLSFDYGSMRPWLEVVETEAAARVGPDLVLLRSPVDLTRDGSSVICEFAIEESRQVVFVLSYGSSFQPRPPCINAAKALVETKRHWRDWISQFQRQTNWPQAIRRSLITLKALIYRPTGGMIAAVTTSLPEKPGGKANWDYRFSWIRDASFTLIALIDAGYKAEATEWQNWLLRAVAGEPDKMRILYRVDGSRRLEEWTADWLPGYRWTTPVRIGNAAASQRQLDIFGELIDSIFIASEAGIKQTAQEEHLLDTIVHHVEQVWRLPDRGLWEIRGEPRHFVYSKVSAWVAIDRYVRHHERSGRVDGKSSLLRMRELRESMHREICREGYDEGLGRFVEYFGGETIDASLLLLPLLGFLPVSDERISRTIDAVERELVVNGLVHRSISSGSESEGAFLACTCWLADCQMLQGRHEAARQSIEHVLASANDLGLLAEEYDVKASRLTGNFPQALSHLAVVRSALRFSGVVTERGVPR